MRFHERRQLVSFPSPSRPSRQFSNGRIDRLSKVCDENAAEAYDQYISITCSSSRALKTLIDTRCAVGVKVLFLMDKIFENLLTKKHPFFSAEDVLKGEPCYLVLWNGFHAKQGRIEELMKNPSAPVSSGSMFQALNALPGFIMSCKVGTFEVLEEANCAGVEHFL